MLADGSNLCQGSKPSHRYFWSLNRLQRIHPCLLKLLSSPWDKIEHEPKLRQGIDTDHAAR